MVTVKVINKRNFRWSKKFDFDLINKSGILKLYTYNHSGLYPVDEKKDLFTLYIWPYKEAIEHIESFSLNGRPKTEAENMIDFTLKVQPELLKKFTDLHGRGRCEKIRELMSEDVEEY